MWLKTALRCIVLSESVMDQYIAVVAAVVIILLATLFVLLAVLRDTVVEGLKINLFKLINVEVNQIKTHDSDGERSGAACEDGSERDPEKS